MDSCIQVSYQLWITHVIVSQSFISFSLVADTVSTKVHGSILRIERPGETKTYLVDAQFPKRSDAKSAVCLLAMSQGVGDYIRELKEAAENKLPADKRKLANEKILQTLAADCGKVRNGNRLIFEFTSGRNGMLSFVLRWTIDSDSPK